MSGLGAVRVDWEDEVDDSETDNLLKYYEEHKSFGEVIWLPVEGTVINSPTTRVKGEKRKVKDIEAENGGRAKKRKMDDHEAEGSGGRPKILSEEWGLMIESTLRNIEGLLKKLVGDGSGAENDPPPPKRVATKVPNRKNKTSARKATRKASLPKGKNKTPPSKRQKDPPPPKAPTPKRKEQPAPEKGNVVTRRSPRNQVAERNEMGAEGERPQEGEQPDDESHVMGVVGQRREEGEHSSGTDSSPKRAETPETDDTLQATEDLQRTEETVQPAAKPEHIVVSSGVAATPLSVVLPVDSSCALLSTNTELQQKATKKKVQRVYNKRPQREKKKAACKKSPFVTPGRAVKDPFIEVKPSRVKDLFDFLERGR